MRQELKYQIPNPTRKQTPKVELLGARELAHKYESVDRDAYERLLAKLEGYRYTTRFLLVAIAIYCASIVISILLLKG